MPAPCIVVARLVRQVSMCVARRPAWTGSPTANAVRIVIDLGIVPWRRGCGLYLVQHLSDLVLHPLTEGRFLRCGGEMGFFAVDVDPQFAGHL